MCNDSLNDGTLTREEITGILAALFLFQYSLLIPLMRFVNASLLIAISELLLLAATFLVNKKVIFSVRTCAVVVVLVAIMLLKVVVDGTDIRVVLNFLLISIPPVVFFSYRFDTGRFLNTCYFLSYLNFVELAALPFLGARSYMRFGNGMTLTCIFMYILVFRDKKDIEGGNKRKKLLSIVVFAISTLELVLYGNRGALIVLLSFIAIDTLLIYREHATRNFFIELIGFIAAFNLRSILEILIRISSRFGVSSYSLRKYQYQLEVGLEGASSGRDRLFRVSWEELWNHPLLGNKMIVYDNDSTYVHNLFLQVGRDLGLLAMGISIAFVLYCLYLMFSKKIDINKKTVIAIFFSVGVVRLLLSSNVWERPEFWALVCIVLDYRRLLCSLQSTFGNAT